MAWTILIVHSEGEEALAEALAQPLHDVGYEVAHRGTVGVGDSFIGETTKALSAGGPVVLCGTVRAAGTAWAHQIVNSARQYRKGKVYVLQMEKEAYVDDFALDGVVARYWQDPDKAIANLIALLRRDYPPGEGAGFEEASKRQAALDRYRELALESCDIIDLTNLPERDRHVATRELELRRLYVALRVRVEIASGAEASEGDLTRIEQRREEQRRSAAGWFGDGKRAGGESQERVSVGERLAQSRRLVVLGDPGSGKTTLTRWIATAYLLRLKRDPDHSALPDVATLPDEDWLPILVRCRDLDHTRPIGSLDDVFRQTFRKSEMSECEAAALQAALRDLLTRGKALLLVDGLDEITDPGIRIRFCQQIENFSIAFPSAPILATSRIVGYREMGYRIGRGFEHITVAEFSADEKDDFARRWCAVTELPERRRAAAEELIHDIHSSDRIERLTGNPMLLTTMALVSARWASSRAAARTCTGRRCRSCSTGAARWTNRSRTTRRSRSSSTSPTRCAAGAFRPCARTRSSTCSSRCGTNIPTSAR